MKIALDRGFQQFLAMNKIDFESLLAEAKIPNLLWQEVLQLDEEQYFHLQEVLSRHLSDEQILMVSNIEKIQLFMPAFFAALSASNGLQALYRFSKYKAIVGPISIDITEKKQIVTVKISPQTSYYKLSYFSVVNELSLILSILRTGSNRFIIPVQVQQPFNLGEKIRDHFNTTLEKSQQVSISFNLNDLEKPFFTTNNTMWQMIKPELERQLQDIKSDKQFLNVVHKELQKLVASGNFSLEILARKLGISTRTLQRKFNKEHTTFKAELQSVQFGMAILFATQENQTMEEIAYLVGYSEVSAFSRAFKKWSGLTLNQYINKKRNK